MFTGTAWGMLCLLLDLNLISDQHIFHLMSSICNLRLFSISNQVIKPGNRLPLLQLPNTSPPFSWQFWAFHLSAHLKATCWCEEAGSQKPFTLDPFQTPPTHKEKPRSNGYPYQSGWEGVWLQSWSWGQCLPLIPLGFLLTVADVL